MGNKIVITVSGGLVTAVYSKEYADVVVIDFDNQHPDEQEEADGEFKKVEEDETMRVIW